MNYPPLILRPEEAVYYVGLGRTVFEKEIRPMLPIILIGSRGIGFDRLDLDDAVSHYKEKYSYSDNETWQSSPDSVGTRKQGKAESARCQKESSSQEDFMQLLAQKRKQFTIKS